MQKLEQLYNEWQSLQPLKPEFQKRLDDKFKLDFNYNTNHIEGNTLTYGQTKLLFMFGETSGNANLKDYEEMKAHNVGLEMMKTEALDKERPLTESFIRELNKIILVQNYWKNAQTERGDPTRIEIKVGDYKSRQNSVRTVTGEVFHYATPEETPAFMTMLVHWFNQEEAQNRLTPIELASLLHYRYIRIHPFEDGNGRIARLLVNYVLYRHGYPMLVVHTEDKENYLRILHQCDINVGFTPSDGANATIEEITPFVEYMKEQLQHALEIGIRAAKGENIEEDDDFAKRIALLKRKVDAEAQKESARTYFSEEQVWNILEIFFFPITRQLESSLKPANVFFAHRAYWNLISKTQYPKGGLHLNDVMRGTKNPQILGFVKNAQSMWYHYELGNPKEKKLRELTIEFDLGIYFHKEDYVITALDNKMFRYGNYPSESECNRIITDYKKFIMDKIEKALK